MVAARFERRTLRAMEQVSELAETDAAVGSRARLALTICGVVALVVFLVGSLVAVGALAFSVTVSGHSMEPTLRDGDRVVVDVFGSEDVERFDLVEAADPMHGTLVVKRVIGLPGDTVGISGGSSPVVTVRPAGDEITFSVENPAWPDRIGTKIDSCCAEDGTVVTDDGPIEVVVPDGAYWLIGDNWGASDDSRTFGFFEASSIQARLVFRILPLSSFGSFEENVRLEPVD